MAAFPFFPQLERMDCGPTCLRMVAKHYGKHFSLATLRERGYISKDGVSMQGISEAAESIGLRSLGVNLSFDRLADEAPMPAIVHWEQNHFVVVYAIRKDKVKIADPAQGLVQLTKTEFLRGWLGQRATINDKGVVLLLEPSPKFFEQEEEAERDAKLGWGMMLPYLKPYSGFLWQLWWGLVIGGLLLLLFPFLTQAIVDVGIGTQNISFVYLILAAQLMLFFSRTAVEFIRSWILLHLSTRINVAIISDFLSKVMRLAIGFFEQKTIGDMLQRIQDHKRIEAFLTQNSLEFLFSIFSLVLLSVVIFIYDARIFGVFWLGSSLHIGYILLFMKKRRQLDHQTFAQESANQSKLVELISGIHEIKLHNIEHRKRWEWEHIQARLFKVRMRSLRLTQFQQAGATLIHELQNIVITVYAAILVIDGDMTVGMLLALTYILGQINAPISSMIGFFQAAQDARISFDRLSEVHLSQDEKTDEAFLTVDNWTDEKDLFLDKVTFAYGGPSDPHVLKDVSITIPQGKTTAIVGRSGSGKTTLLKLLLKFYAPLEGKIYVGGMDLRHVSPKDWRRQIGVVMQDGFIFSDTIAQNIALEKPVDRIRLIQAVTTANIQEFIDRLPHGFQTEIGEKGVGLSAGQKQRLLIARAVYKQPELLLFDEATNALDAHNERIIVDRLDKFFAGRTVVVVAHRLSTVQDADQIVVLDEGRVVETGNHQSLTAKRGAYYELVKNQLELGT